MDDPPRWFDFHLHTSCSDGAQAPLEVLGSAFRSGLQGISITDHDTVDAYGDLGPSTGASGPVRVLPGVEISAALGGSEVHVLGYFPDGFSRGVESYVKEVLARRRRRISAAVRRLRERGLDVSLEELKALSGSGVVGLSHLADLLVKKRYCGKVHSAYHRFLGPGALPLPEDRAEDVVRQIARLGGLAVWAHPGKSQMTEGLGVLVDAGLAGVEAYIPRKSAREQRETARRARDRGLFVTGGSDCHGRRPGPMVGDFRVRESAVSEFVACIGWKSGAAPAPGNKLEDTWKFR